MSQPKRHHYIPIFYLKPWCDERGQLCEFSKPQKKVAFKWRHPHATAFVEGLYTIPGLPPEDAEYVERAFMGAVDFWAARAHRIFLDNNPGKRDVNAKQLVGWARFLYSLMLRNPEQIEDMTRKAAAKYQYEGPVQVLLPEFINSTAVIGALADMKFHSIFVADETKHTFLTSDRPIIMTEGLKVPDAYIMIPISPRSLFVAVQDEDTWKRISGMPLDRLVEAVNDRVCSQARKFVYGADQTQLRFVQNRFGKKLRATPLDD